MKLNAVNSLSLHGLDTLFFLHLAWCGIPFLFLCGILSLFLELLQEEAECRAVGAADKGGWGTEGFLWH